MRKILGILLLSILALVIPLSVSAASFSFQDIDIEGIDMSIGGENPTVYAEKGGTVNIRVEVKAEEEVNDLKIKAWIGGYEYEDIEDVTEMFDLDENVTVVKYLDLEIPEDINANEEYTLHIKAYDQNDDIEEEFTLQIEAQRHQLSMQDVIFAPGLSINANTPLFVTVRVENIGDKKEDDIRIEVSIPALGITQVDYIDELVSNEDPGNENEETSDSTDTLFLDLSNAAPGTYTLNVNVEYNNGYSELSESYDLTVTGTGAGASGAEVSGDVIDVANKVKTVAQGESVVYKVDIANLGNSAKTYSAELFGLDTWATTSRIDPSFVLVQAGNVGELYVYVSASADATAGQHLFTVKVKEGSTIVKEINLEANVTPKAATASSWGNIIKGLEVGFIVLLIILIILGIIIAITKMKGKSEETLTSGEGQTYY